MQLTQHNLGINKLEGLLSQDKLWAPQETCRKAELKRKADSSEILIEGSEETYYCDDEFECDPHKEVEVFEYQVENLLAILSLWGRYDIFSKSLGQSSDCNRFET